MTKKQIEHDDFIKKLKESGAQIIDKESIEKEDRIRKYQADEFHDHLKKLGNYILYKPIL